MKTPIKSVISVVIACLQVCAFAKGGTFTERDLSQVEVAVAISDAGIPVQRVGLFWSAKKYAQFSREGLTQFQADYLHQLSRRGVPVSLPLGKSGWQSRFNCVAFSRAWQAESSIALMRELFHSRSEAALPASFIVAFTPDSAAPGAPGHAIVLVLTDRGPVWWDPQTGEHRKLSDTELKTVWFPQ